MRRINVAIAGLGRVGSQFLEALLKAGSETSGLLRLRSQRKTYQV